MNICIQGCRISNDKFNKTQERRNFINGKNLKSNNKYKHLLLAAGVKIIKNIL